MAVSIKGRSILAVAAVSAGIAPVFAEEAPPATFNGMFTDGKLSFDFRYRYEYVDQDNIKKDANASTLRSRMTFASAAYQGFSFLGQFDNVSTVGPDDYNSTQNGKTQYPVVADPTYTEVNQAWLKYAHGSASGTYGRQAINLGNQRFIGTVGWRQNEQTYDGFRALYSIGSLSLDYTYAYNVNRIFGPDDSKVQPGNLHGDNHFVRIEWKAAEKQTLAGFYYYLDINDYPQYAIGKSAGNSSETYGIVYDGSIGPVTLHASYATQSEAGDAPVDYDTDYYTIEAKTALAGIGFTLGYEVLAGNDGVGFKTPYATLHKFQGWADQFLVTPADGVEDLYAGLAGALGPVKLQAVYHDFQAEDASGDYGHEVDLAATWPVSANLSLQLKYAGFRSDSDSYTDVDKAWMTVQFKI